MVTLEQHIETLAKYSVFSKEEILDDINKNKHIIDEDSLLCYSVFNTCRGNYMVILFESGNGEKIDEWANNIAKENKCISIFGLTKRWRAFGRKYKFKPVGVLMSREGFA